MSEARFSVSHTSSSSSSSALFLHALLRLLLHCLCSCNGCMRQSSSSSSRAAAEFNSSSSVVAHTDCVSVRVRVNSFSGHEHVPRSTCTWRRQQPLLHSQLLLHSSPTSAPAAAVAGIAMCQMCKLSLTHSLSNMPSHCLPPAAALSLACERERNDASE